jgi:hypothetical protein
MAISNGYSDVDTFMEWTHLGNPQRPDVRKMEIAIEAASRQIDAFTGWPHGFWQDSTVVAREFYATGPDCLYISEGISTTTGLIVKTDDDDDGTFETTLTISTNFILLPANAADQSPVEPYTEIRLVDYATVGFPGHTSGRPGVQVTAKFGWPAVPTAVENACLIQAETLFKASASGTIQFGDGFSARVPWMNPSASALLEGFCRPRVG